MAEVGEARTPLLLAALCLALISREAEAAPVLQSHRGCAARLRRVKSQAPDPESPT